MGFRRRYFGRVDRVALDDQRVVVVDVEGLGETRLGRVYCMDSELCTLGGIH